MASHLILGCNLSHDIRIRLGDPADHEKSSLRICLLQDTKNALHILIDTHFKPFPLLLGACRVVIEEMKPFLDVES